MNYLVYKASEHLLQDMYPGISVTIEKITGADMIYTDGDASSTDGKVVFRKNGITDYTVYIPQVIAYPNRKEYDRDICIWLTNIDKSLIRDHLYPRY